MSWLRLPLLSSSTFTTECNDSYRLSVDGDDGWTILWRYNLYLFTIRHSRQFSYQECLVSFSFSEIVERKHGNFYYFIPEKIL